LPAAGIGAFLPLKQYQNGTLDKEATLPRHPTGFWAVGPPYIILMAISVFFLSGQNGLAY